MMIVWVFNQVLIDVALGVLIWLAIKNVGQGGFLKLVVPAWLYHIDAFLRGKDAPGDEPVPPPPAMPLSAGTAKKILEHYAAEARRQESAALKAGRCPHSGLPLKKDSLGNAVPGNFSCDVCDCGGYAENELGS